MYPEFQFESWSLSTYYLVLSIDFCFMIFYLRHRAQQRGFPVLQTLDLGIISSICGFLGARLLHVFYEAPAYYFKNPLSVFLFWEGGYVFFGGILGGLFGGLLWLKIKRKNPLPYLDLFAPILALGYAIGRLACFLQGCCYGQETHSILGVHFDSLIHTGENSLRLPTQLFASMGELVLYLILIFIEKKQSPSLREGQLFTYWMVGHGINRMAMELFRNDPRGPLLFHMGLSFWLALGLFIAGLRFNLYWRRPSPL